MSKQNNDSKIPSNSSDKTFQPLEYGDHLEPPFWGTSNILSWSNEMLFQSIKKDKLFGNEWSDLMLGPEAFVNGNVDRDMMFSQLQKEVIDSELFDAAGYYGFFPVITDDELLIVLDPSDFSTELITLQFPRIKESDNRSICDYFRPSGDLIGFHSESIGFKAEKKYREYLNTIETSTKGYYLCALAKHCNHIVAEKISNEIRRCLGLERANGRRYNFGDPEMPSLELGKPLFELLSLEERLGIEITDQFELSPAQSGVGIFIHHPSVSAKPADSAGNRRVEPS
jgi:5-methyltetrahydrofolate--homocysteine methyltransferase